MWNIQRDTATKTLSTRCDSTETPLPDSFDQQHSYLILFLFNLVYLICFASTLLRKSSGVLKFEHFVSMSPRFVVRIQVSFAAHTVDQNIECGKKDEHRKEDTGVDRKFKEQIIIFVIIAEYRIVALVDWNLELVWHLNFNRLSGCPTVYIFLLFLQNLLSSID